MSHNALAVPEVEKAQDYLNSTKTVRARFVQTLPDGQKLNGTFLLKRPGKMRIEYDPPIKDFVVADGLFIYFYDGELRQQTNAPIGQTLADFLLRDPIDLSEDSALQVIKILEGPKLLQIVLAQKDNIEAGQLTLGFDKAPFTLRKWRVTDSVGTTTEVLLSDIDEGIFLPDDIFYYFDPKDKEPQYNE